MDRTTTCRHSGPQPVLHVWQTTSALSVLSLFSSKADPMKVFFANGLVDHVVAIGLPQAFWTGAHSHLRRIAPAPSQNGVFSPQNWTKPKGCLAGIQLSARRAAYFNMLPAMQIGTQYNPSRAQDWTPHLTRGQLCTRSTWACRIDAGLYFAFVNLPALATSTNTSAIGNLWWSAESADMRP